MAFFSRCHGENAGPTRVAVGLLAARRARGATFVPSAHRPDSRERAKHGESSQVATWASRRTTAIRSGREPASLARRELTPALSTRGPGKKNLRSTNKKRAPAQIRTGVDRFRVCSDSRYTTGARLSMDDSNIDYNAAEAKQSKCNFKCDSFILLFGLAKKVSRSPIVVPRQKIAFSARNTTKRCSPGWLRG